MSKKIIATGHTVNGQLVVQTADEAAKLAAADAAIAKLAAANQGVLGLTPFVFDAVVASLRATDAPLTKRVQP